MNIASFKNSPLGLVRLKAPDTLDLVSTSYFPTPGDYLALMIYWSMKFGIFDLLNLTYNGFSLVGDLDPMSQEVL